MAARIDGKKSTILIADDDPTTRMLLRATVSQWDFSVQEACDGEAAWRILKEPDAPQLVTVDWMMPKIDGPELCRLAKSLPTPPYMILLTSLTGSANIVNALDAGADDFLTKPFNYAELRSRIFVGQRVVDYTRRLELVAQQKKKEAQPPDELPRVIQRLQIVHQQMNEEWDLLQQYRENLGELRQEERLALEKIAQDIYSRQQQLTLEIKNLGVLLGMRDTNEDLKVVNSRKAT